MHLVAGARITSHPYARLREVLETFVAATQAELGQELVGIYLVGSLAVGDFDLDSDVDFLVITRTELTERAASHLQALQVEIHGMDCYPAQHLEGSYIGLEDLNDWSTVGEKRLYYFDNGSTTLERSVHDNNWHVRWILRERGITLVGPEPATLVRAIPVAALLDEMSSALLSISRAFTEALERPLNFWNSRFGQSFAVLTACRMLHTLHTGTVASKKAGARWAKQHLGPPWAALIDRAWHEREGVRFGVKIGQRADARRLDETVEFLEHALTLTETLRMPLDGR